ncbi:LCP family protein [Klenkia taihuensis]|uniref:Transcriptional attenuator, LytR family n=1 Tax=Klenkia taihuensis TaxID=1225127 RepID=A0A1I1T6A9_9ACTN|nr:LCP family protein [Klenkia taihuensis]GHE13047.1 LytTR family transcriptional regulator [Klenkia taihuensis]SFD52658.1 transcriptional attenuator, LytR family [Klenkia taihuensis]
MSDDRAAQLPARLDPRLGRPAGSAARTGTRRAAVVVRGLAAVLSMLLVAGSGWGWYLVRVAEASVNRTDAIPTTGNTDINGDTHAGQAMNMLLVGVDSRAGLTQEQIDEYATGDPDDLHNTDTMMLVHVPADGSAASFVSFPRDMYVQIPGHGRGKLNSAYSAGFDDVDGSEDEKRAGGARLLIQTISNLSGLQIDHYAEINLLGFINLTSIVGGVDVDLCQASDDSVTGAHFDAGPQTLSGSQALLFVRQRHGVGERSSDFDRVARQQVFIAGMLRNLLSSDLMLNPNKQRQVVEQVGSSVTLDRGLDIFTLAAQMQGVQPGSITFQTIPGLTDADVDGVSVLKLPPAQVLTDFFSDLTADPEPQQAPAPAQAPATVAPADVTVSVLNGSGVSGAAAGAAGELTAAGFAASSGGNAPATATTTISHRTGDDAAAATLAAQVPGAALAVDDSLAAGTVSLVLGTDFTGVGQQVATATPTEDPVVPGSYVNPERTAADTSCIN